MSLSLGSTLVPPFIENDYYHRVEIARWMQRKALELISSRDINAVGDGITNDALAFDALIALARQGYRVLIPPNTYLDSGSAVTTTSDFTWLNNQYTGAINILQEARVKCMLVTVENEDSTPADATKARMGIGITAIGKGAHHIDGIRSNLTNSSTDGNGNTAFYGAATSTPSANWSTAVHSETKHANGTTICLNAEAKSFATTGTVYGLVLNNVTGSGGVHPTTSLSTTAHASITGMLLQGTNNIDASGGWVRGIHIGNNSLRGSAVTILVVPLATVSAHFQTGTSSPATVADIFLQGNSTVGLICNGSYSSGNAIRIATGQALSLITTGTHKILAGTGSPESAITATIGSLYCRTDGGAGTTLYVKESGSGNTGWVAK